jgi:molybdate transport system permease protein
LTLLLGGLVGLFLGLPVAVLVVRAAAGGALQVAIGDPAVLDALQLSLITTAVSLVLTIAIATPVAHLLARRRFRGASFVEAIVDLPIVLPPSVAGLALLLTFGRRGVLGDELAAFGIAIPFTTVAVILAQMFVSMPFFIRAARAGFRGVDRDFEDAARVDGAGERQVAWSITVPLAWTALASGVVMTWARALGEFGATIIVAGSIPGETRTLAVAIYSYAETGQDGQAIRLVLVSVAIAFVALWSANRLVERRAA